MRNLAKYPITKEEKLEALNWALQKWEEEYGEHVGNVMGYALQLVREQVDGEG